MHQIENTISIPVIILTLGLYTVICFAQENSVPSTDSLSDTDFELRPQDSGAGKRVYGYLSEFKRYPVYSFGLGKRSHLYNFGLGKRSRYEENGDDVEEYDEFPYSDDEEQIPELELYHDDTMQNMEKRQKLYNFGLGKRLHRYDFGLGKRDQFHRYDFGLGKRSQPVLNRDRLYNFGLGKRNRLYSFGLGKRPSAPGRFNFGLGKRSESFDVTKNIITKREVHEKYVPEISSHPTVETSTEKLSHSEPESHEVMGHPAKSQVSKRSPHRYTYDMGKSSYVKNGFSRQFRKPMYNFGLGKRAPLTNSANNNNLSGK